METSKHYGSPNPKELEKINTLSLKPLTQEDVFSFSVTLCDNEVDRDFECFDVDALTALAPLFVGKPGIYDHSMKAKDMSCRVYETYIEQPDGMVTSYGEPYVRLMAKAYCLNTPENRSLIKDIEGGIKKEVSVSCSVLHRECSVCGKNSKTDFCEHKGGRFYRKDGSKRLCYHTLKSPTDAYEFSFVAVPAQKNAGVTKSLFELNELMKSQGSTVIDKGCYSEINDRIDALEKRAAIADEYEQSLRDEIAAYCSVGVCKISSTSADTLCKGLDIEALKELRNTLKARASFDGVAQLIADKKPNNQLNNNYKI
ncbi:MAG: hypothetical protein IJ462_03735 [Clostridia bacterium]|nr:hypothetical protein [Clostridia bacterium]